MSGCSQHHPTTSWNWALHPGCSSDTVPSPEPGSAAGAWQALEAWAGKEGVSAGTPTSGFWPSHLPAAEMQGLYLSLVHA